MQLPADIREKIEALFTGTRDRYKEAAQDMSLKYRRETNGDLQIQNLEAAKAYAATRLPATYAAVADVLQKLLIVDGDFNPTTMLDLGAGPGTATLAACQLWPEISPTLIEPNVYLRAVGEELLPHATWQNQKLQNLSLGTDYDLTIASYVFNEISEDFESILEKIWTRTKQAFILIEPGTPHGYETILKARDYFRRMQQKIAAPCPHAFECPLRNSDRWCHFGVRVERSRLHKQIKADAVLAYEDEKFSYLIITRNPVLKTQFRLLGRPHGKKIVEVETCQDNGAFEILKLPPKDPLHKTVRKMHWGDAFFKLE